MHAPIVPAVPSGARRAAALLAFLVLAGCSTGAPTAAPGTPGSTTAAPPTTAAPTSGGGSPTTGADDQCVSGISSDPVTITFWTSTEQQGEELTREKIAEYEALHPNVTINFEVLGLFDSLDRWNVATPAGEGPTLMLAFEPWIEIFHQAGQLAPVMPAAMCEASMEDVIGRYEEGTVEPLTRDGQLYAIPEQRNGWSFFVNNDKFTAAGFDLASDIPETWTELAEMQDDLLVRDGDRVTQKGFEFRYTSGPHWMAMQTTAMIYQLGGDVIDENGAPTFNGPEGVEALTQWKANVVAPEVSANVENSPYQDFADEQDVMSFGGPNALSFIYELNPDLEGRVTVASMPDAGPDFPGGMSYGFHQVVNSDATEAEQAAAWNLIDFIYDDSRLWFERTGLLQPKLDWWEDPATQEQFEGLDVYMNDLIESRALPRTPHWSALQAAIRGAVERIAFEDADVKASLDQAAQEYSEASGQ